MIRPSPARGVFALLVTLLATAAFGHDREADTRLTRHLDADVQAAKITRDESIAHKLSAFLAPALLPDQYRGELPHCGTELLLRMFGELEEADPNVRELVRYALTPPSRRGEMPDAGSLPREYRAVASELLRRAEVTTYATHSSPHFLIHYETSGADQATFLYVLELGDALERAYRILVEAYGFTPPAAGADGQIDVVIKANVPCPFPTPIDFCNVAGTAIPPLVEIAGYAGPAIFIQNNLRTSYLQISAAHEFFHLLQYEGGSLLAMLFNYWWCEGSAAAIEDVVYPANNEYISHLRGPDGFLARTDEPLGSMSYHTVLYHRFLMEKYNGGAPVILREILHELETKTFQNAIETVLASYVTTPVEAFQRFALWNLNTNGNATPPDSYFDAALYPDFTNFQGTHTLTSSSPQVPVSPKNITGTTAHYYRFLPDASLTAQRKLMLTVKTTSFGRIRGWVVVRHPSGPPDIHDLTGLNNLNPATAHDLTINDFSPSTVKEVVLILANGHPTTETYLATYEARLNPSPDIAFVIDTTGSMSSSITALKNSVLTALQILNLSGADFRIAVTEFKDHPVSPYGDATDFPYRADSPFSSQQAVIQAGLNMLVARGGNDWPESQYSGIMGAINAVGITPWRAGAQKSIIIMTDAPPHNPEPITNYTAASVIAAANAGGISLPAGLPAGSPTGSNAESIVRRPSAIEVNAGNPIRIYGIVVGGDVNARNALTQLADGTGGKVYSATYSVNDIVNKLLEVVGDIGEEQPPVNRPPDAASAIGTPSPIWPASNRMVPVAISNITDPDGDPFTIRVTGVTQDEPVNAKNQGRRDPDATGVGTATASVRAERDGDGNGRVYVISFTATDSRGASANGSVSVCVPHDQGGNSTCTDDGQAYSSTEP
ncbi:MAG TPA: vWA domain-containing protein [Thermoanaerobaculia bacterium]|nr:vWA domain-containing protein [Thermoanaerobaculia bacterium]